MTILYSVFVLRFLLFVCSKRFSNESLVRHLWIFVFVHRKNLSIALFIRFSSFLIRVHRHSHNIKYKNYGMSLSHLEASAKSITLCFVLHSYCFYAVFHFVVQSMHILNPGNFAQFYFFITLPFDWIGQIANILFTHYQCNIFLTYQALIICNDISTIKICWPNMPQINSNYVVFHAIRLLFR